MGPTLGGEGLYTELGKTLTSHRFAAGLLSRGERERVVQSDAWMNVDTP